ncbi:hypothetical protein B0H21DRAFT_685524 [Amylocystis lapponica]|nr:hypothetical protein B0H21DRAFT_685524 [Amylocystis lapponica]
MRTPVSDRPTSSSTLVSAPVVKVIPKRPPFPHPPPLNFESVPVSQRSMTLEAAQWSLTSEQLQELVSHAIRKSAEESFIRLVSLKTFDEELPAELERLSTLQATTQAQYRFKMHRRAMLLQSLNALSFNQSTETNDGEALANLTTQLAELTISCDRLMEMLISVADQRAQLQHMQDVHVSSALAMGLRKLNASYGKRKTELKVTRAELDELKAELRDAWLVAEDMAQEMDDLDNFPRDDFESAGDDSASLAGGRLTTSSVESAQVVEVTGTAVASTATLASLPPVEDSDHAGRVSAARKRSVRVSNLRLHGLSVADGAAGPSRRGRKPSLSTKIPGLSVIQVDTASLSEGSFLEMAETRPATPASAVTLDMPPAPVPPVPPLPTLGSSMSVDALGKTSSFLVHGSLHALSAADIPYSKPPLSSPGFDRSFIPPDTQAFPTPHTPGHELSFGQRIQSLNLNLSAEATSKLKSLLGMRRSKSENRPAMRRADSAKANRFSAPLRAVGEVILPADTHTTEDPACGPACAAAGDER